MVVVASEACPRFCCAISIGIPLAIAWLASEWRIQCVLARAKRSAPLGVPLPSQHAYTLRKERLDLVVERRRSDFLTRVAGLSRAQSRRALRRITGLSEHKRPLVAARHCHMVAELKPRAVAVRVCHVAQPPDDAPRLVLSQ
jgi:hypothetical protein